MTSVPPQTARQPSNRSNDRKRSGHGSRSGRGERRVEVVGGGGRSDSVNVTNRGGSAGVGLGDAGQGKTSAELVKEAKSQIKLLDQLLHVKEPWDKDVDLARGRIRACYKQVHFSHPTSPGAQSIDHLWIYTTHVVIARYRSLIASLDKQVLIQQQQHPNEPRRNEIGRRSGQNQARETGPVEIRKVLTRFKSFLCSEQSFYRGVITSFVETFELCRLGPRQGQGHGQVGTEEGRLAAQGQGQEPRSTEVEVDVQAYLEVVGIPVSSREDPRDDIHTTGNPGKVTLNHDEALKKVGLVHKALVCLGDLERYKEQYGSERDKLFGQSGRQGRRRQAGDGQGGTGQQGQAGEGEGYTKAKGYYEVARGLLPDNGNPSNQMAVIATYARDMFTSVYHYYRALACQQPFLTARQNLDKMLRKCLDEWRQTRPSDPSEDAGFPELDPNDPLHALRSEEVILQAVLITGDPTPTFENLVADHAVHLGRLLAGRAVPAEVIVKTIVMAITCHWDIRLREAPEDDNGDEDHEGAALWYLFNIAGVMLDVADQEVKDGLGAGRLASLNDETVLDEPAQADYDSLTGLYPYITAVLRRLLPALRIFSKWLKANASLLSENSIAQQEEFWTTYASFCRHLEALFPLARLPELSDALEEDFDMRGFSPLKRGMMETRRGTESNEQGTLSHNLSDVHPNEEQLMRISDLLCDGKLIANYAPAAFRRTVQPASFASRVGLVDPAMRNHLEDDHRPTLSLATADVYGGLATLQPPNAHPREESEFGDAVSVSTATEDDPVNLAMRATLADGSSLADDDERPTLSEAEDEDDDDDEEIIWPNRQNRFSKDATAESAGLVTPTMAMQNTFKTTGAAPTSAQPSSTRAHDLLHSLMTGSPAARPSSQTGSPVPSNSAASPFSNTASPLLFGGVGFSSGGSIWTRGLNEPDGEVERSRSGSGFARAGSVAAQHGLHGWSSGPNMIGNGRSESQNPNLPAFPPHNSNSQRPYSPFG